MSSLVKANNKGNEKYLQSILTNSYLHQHLLAADEWVPYPKYDNREGWDETFGSLKENIIKRGEEVIDYEWKVVTATDYLRYEREGGSQMYGAFFRNREVFNFLILAELAEGKGRFIDQILNGAWYYCEQTSWAIAAHIKSVQRNYGVLPFHDSHGIGLAVGDIAASMAWTYYFFKDEFDKINPLISKRIKQNLEKRIMDDYMAREDYWWMAIRPETTGANNWNVWINSNVMLTFLLVEDDREMQIAALNKIIQSIDGFIKFVNADGACEEGPTYWDRAGGKLYDCLQILDYATKKDADYWQTQLIKNLGEYIAKSYIGDGYVVNFADASPRNYGNFGLVYRFGKAIDSEEMIKFAAYLYKAAGNKPDLGPNNDIFRALETCNTHKDLVKVDPELPTSKFIWYPETEFCYMRSKNAFVGSKGGFNAESHNHNDVGSFIYYLNSKPIFLDTGSGTYTKKTFSSERYTIWTFQSQYHNIPIINGKGQLPGGQYKSLKSTVNEKKLFCSYDISGAYGKDANVKKWIRSYKLANNDQLIIKDEFELTKNSGDNEVVFMVKNKPVIENYGCLIVSYDKTKAALTYDEEIFEPTIEEIESGKDGVGWGKEIYRIRLVAKKQMLSGTYSFVIKPLK
ncbi:MAG: heparinase II/III-family protein [Carboxylicivirga sp.]|jgi:hypothetical protein|nr:heparinase II/III-family protein [Carboxylicivirga sp.]